jgi:non-homologous end joining protein Ku
MAPRATWKGYLKLSLVSCPVRLYNATSSSNRVTFHLVHKKTQGFPPTPMSAIFMLRRESVAR